MTPEQLFRSLVLWMIGQAGVIHAFDFRVSLQEVCQSLSVGADPVHAQGQCFGADG